MPWDWEKLQKQKDKHRQFRGMETDELVRKMKSMKLPGGPILIIVLIVVFLGYSIFFTIKADEVGIIQRFGKYTRTCQPGLNFKLPNGIEKVTKVKIKRVYKEEFGFNSVRGRGMSRFATESESPNTLLMLTGDLNVAVVPWIVQYRIKDPCSYLFKVRNARKLLQDMSEATMRLVVGDRSINEVISKRQEIASEAEHILQIELDDAETGINVVTIEMKKTNVPEPVQPSFNEVNQATQEKEKTIYQAKEEYNKAVPAARGEAERVIKSAEGDALNIVNRAEGDAQRFKSFYEEYAKAKDITRRRIYLETIEEIFPKMGDKYIVDENQKNLLPLLNLDRQNKGVTK